MSAAKHKTSYIPLITFLFLFLMCSISYSQSDSCISATKKVFNTLLNSIGNNFPSPPNLIFSDKERFVAAVSNNQIIIEKKALSILCSFSDSESAIAYVLSHELAHYYLNHSWMSNTGLSYVSSLGQFLNDKFEGLEVRKIEETQADLFGGFFSQISGYNSLSIAPEVLNEIYVEYDLPHQLNGYPTLNERKLIINVNLEEIRKLNLIFEAGKLNILKGDYDLAKKCYSHILNKKFTSREIYNNLGSVYLNIAISNFDENISKFIYPIFYENNSRAGKSEIRNETRGPDDILTNPIEQLDLAIDAFKRSISLDNDFYPAKINLIIAEMIKNKIEGINGEELVLLNLRKIENINNEDYLDIIILSNLLFSNKKKKIKKLLKDAGQISRYNYKILINNKKFNIDEIKTNPENYSQINIDELLLIGLKKPYEYMSSGKGIKVKKKVFKRDIVYEINYSSYFIEINNKDYSTSKEIKIGENISNLKKSYGFPDEIHKFGEHLYFVYRNNKIIFFIMNDKVFKIIIYS